MHKKGIHDFPRETHVQLPGGLELLLLQSYRTQTPSAGVEVTLHDTTLDLGNNTVVAGGQLDGRHLGDTDGNRLTLGSHEDNLLMSVNAGLFKR